MPRRKLQNSPLMFHRLLTIWKKNMLFSLWPKVCPGGLCDIIGLGFSSRQKENRSSGSADCQY